MAVDNKENAIIVWSDDVVTKASVSSALYLLHFNSSKTQKNEILATQGSLILWPSLAGDKNGTIYMAWTEYDPSTEYAIVEYGTIRSATVSLEKQIASYNGVPSFPPKARVVLDNSSGPLQVAWGESQADGQFDSTVNYAKVGFNGTVLDRLQVARFAATLRDLTITPTTGQDGAFVVWQTQTSNESVYVSEISAGGQLAYLKELNYTTGQSKYLAFSADGKNNLYVMWYQPSVLAATTISMQAPPTNVTYLRMNLNGVIVQTGSDMFRSPIIGVTVLNDGNLYGVSPDGLVNVVTPTQAQNNSVWVATVALMSCMGVAGSLWIEEGRYKWIAFCSRLASPSPKQSRAIGQDVLRLLIRKPGLNIHDIKRHIGSRDVGTSSLIGMERTGLIASFRDGFSRRFYVKAIEGELVDSLRNRIMLWVLDHPGIWEAQLAKDLRLSQQIVHYHLKNLRESKLITAMEDSEGGRKFYRFAYRVPCPPDQ
jgi:DNA-binding transcriptional ArsR family regulator